MASAVEPASATAVTTIPAPRGPVRRGIDLREGRRRIWLDAVSGHTVAPRSVRMATDGVRCHGSVRLAAGRHAMRPPTTEDDLLDLLAREHRNLAAAVADLLRAAAGLDSEERRRRLREPHAAIQVHLALEDLIVHPLATRALASGRRSVASDRRDDLRLERALAEATWDVGDERRFMLAMEKVLRGLGTHADREELEVFPFARYATPSGELRRMAEWRRSTAFPVSDWSPTDGHGTTVLRQRLERALGEVGPPSPREGMGRRSVPAPEPLPSRGAARERSREGRSKPTGEG